MHLVRDARGQKMSSPAASSTLELDRYGCDALRFTLRFGRPGRDIKPAGAGSKATATFANQAVEMRRVTRR